MNPCYISYGIRFEMITHIIIATATTALGIKLFILYRYDKSKEYLRKANRLALIDTSAIIIFSVIPATLSTSFITIDVDVCGNVFILGKVCGYVFEGYLAHRTLYKTQSNQSNGSVLVARVKV
ncbi:Protein CBG27344 [Caenorhabditis briggsae]|uniref:Protein CBG27344 n=1 Tax=Caenorhabditis briggsae TaxID=6238 RepID=B6IGE5_CAEBR|nr:Protein CBG27344 [Caenorhabditis briggsae]CAR98975.1 Protein CBG27344 [Caenorhabditis briggsae]